MGDELKKYIRSINDFPKKGIVFRDITTLLKDPVALKKTSTLLFGFTKNKNISKVVGIESRGFMFGITLAEKLDVGFVPCRKPGKLPAETESITYDLEYGNDTLEIHKDAIKKGDRILLHDDLLATGGTAQAACRLIEKLGGQIVQVSFVIELTFLQGRKKLKDYDVRALIDYDSEI
ncbi:MAG: adenine phosphoribosyltransferase [Ignavibacteriales bacterium]|nr:MAG: adenine phosphoribosyltransferase [Ignavibacteriales bacterium]